MQFNRTANQPRQRGMRRQPDANAQGLASRVRSRPRKTADVMFAACQEQRLRHQRCAVRSLHCAIVPFAHCNTAFDPRARRFGARQQERIELLSRNAKGLVRQGSLGRRLSGKDPQPIDVMALQAYYAQPFQRLKRSPAQKTAA